MRQTARGALDNMSMTVVETGPLALPDYADVPGVFVVQEIMEVLDSPSAPHGARLQRCRLSKPYLKDYDAPPALSPSAWSSEFDVSQWGILSAQLGDEDVGRVAIAWRTPDMEVLEGRNDLAVLWDLRVRPSDRRQGIGTTLFNAAAEWARSRGARTLKVETQNVNVAACLFYEAQGCSIGAINRGAYSELPDEVQILWYKDLATPSAV